MKWLNEWMKNGAFLDEAKSVPDIDDMLNVLKEIQSFLSKYESYLQGVKKGAKPKAHGQKLIDAGNGIRDALKGIDDGIAYGQIDDDGYKAFYMDCLAALRAVKRLAGGL